MKHPIGFSNNILKKCLTREGKLGTTVGHNYLRKTRIIDHFCKSLAVSQRLNTENARFWWILCTTKEDGEQFRAKDIKNDRSLIEVGQRNWVPLYSMTMA